MGNRVAIPRRPFRNPSYTIDIVATPTSEQADDSGDPADRPRLTLASSEPRMAFPNDGSALHERTVKSICVGGEYVFVGSWDRTASMWELATGEFVRSFRGHKQDIIGICVYEQWLFTCGDCVRMWDTRTGDQLAAFGSKDEEVTATFYTAICDFSAPGLIVCGFCRGPLQIFDFRAIADKYPQRRERAAVAGERMRPQCGMRPVHIFEGHTAGVMGMDLGNVGDDRLLVSASIDKTARVWSIRRGVCTRTLVGHEAPLRDCKLHLGRVYTASLDKTAREWDAITGACTRIFRTPEGPVRALALVGSVLFTAEATQQRSLDQPASYAVREFDLESGEQVAAHDALHDGGIFCLHKHVAPNGTATLFTGSQDRFAKQWALREPGDEPAATVRPPQPASAEPAAEEEKTSDEHEGEVRRERSSSSSSYASASALSRMPSEAQKLPTVDNAALSSAAHGEVAPEEAVKLVEAARARIEELEETTRCFVCIERPKNAAYMPCGHQSCRRCAERFRTSNCPLCRQPVTGVLALYG